MESIYGSLVDMVIAVGLSEATGLIPSNPQPPPMFHHENRLFCTAFDTQIIGAVSNSLAVFPMENQPQDPNYPPASVRKQQSVSRTDKHTDSIYKTWAPSKTKIRTPIQRKYQRNLSGTSNTLRSRSNSFRVFDFAPKQSSSENLTLKAADLPLRAETLQSLMMFCFPDGAYVKGIDRQSSVHYLVLTDITGDRSHAVCLTMYLAHKAKKDSEGDSWQCTRYEEPQRNGSRLDNTIINDVIYLPLCLVTISKKPYYTLLTDCLSKLVERLKYGATEWKHTLKEFTLHMTSICTPPPGFLRVNFELFQETKLQLIPPEHHGISVSDHALNLPFMHLSIKQVLRVFSAILTQQRIVFMSTHHTLLVLVCESFQQLMYPFTWSYTYVPLLSWNLVELIEAPGTFIMGCHERHRHFIERVEGLVVVDLDVGQINVCPTLDLPKIPQSPSDVFTLAVQQTKRHIDWLGLSWPTLFSQEATRCQECDQRTQTNKLIQTACLELMANLFREVFSHANKETRFFHKEQFLQGIDSDEKKFYEMVLQTDLFGEFLKDRLSVSNQPDYWSEFLEKTKPYNRHSLLPTHTDMNRLANRSVIRKSQSLSTLSTHVGFVSESPRTSVINLPSFVYGLSHVYIDNCLLEIDNKLKECISSEVRGVCIFLRGVYLAAQNKKTEALEAFHAVESCDSQFFPLKFVGDILRSLSPEQKETVHRSFFYDQSALFTAAEHHTNQSLYEPPVIMELNKIPEADIDLQGFRELVQLLFELTPDTEAVNRLFDALTLGEKTVVDPGTFEEFYKSWKENEVMLQQVQIPSDSLDNDEVLLKISDMCKCSSGTGRLGLTQKRIIFLPEGSRKCKEVIQLRHIKLLELTQQRSLLKPVTAIKISHIDERIKSFTATLKDACNQWLLLVNEMWAGKALAEETRNPDLVHIASQHVLLVNAFIESGQTPMSHHHGCELQEAESLCYFTQRKRCNTNLPPETKELLQQKLDPSGHEEQRTSVMTLLYTAGKRTGSTVDDYVPRLWVGMGSGKLVIYDAINWSLEAQLALSVCKLTCLVDIQGRQIWVGSADTNIYIVNQRTKSTNQTLSDHRGVVVDFTEADVDGTYSCSDDGHIIKWSTRTLKIVWEHHLVDSRALRSIRYHNQQLWCATADEFLLLSTNGNILKRLSPELPGHHDNLCQIDCFLLTPQNELWIGMGHTGVILVYYADSLEQKNIIYLLGRGATKFCLVLDKIWVGTREGRLLVYNSCSNALEQTLYAHADTINAITTANDRYIISGSGTLDGKISIWKVKSGVLNV